MVLYPAFQALTIRWWASGLRFGELAVHSQLRTKQIYGAYLRFLLYSFAFGLVGAIMVGMAIGSFNAIFKAIGKSQLTEFVGVGLALVGLCGVHARLFDHLSGHREACDLAVRHGRRST